MIAHCCTGFACFVFHIFVVVLGIKCTHFISLHIFHITLLTFNGNAQILWFCRQGGKDQAKKGSNIKLGLQGDKKGLGQDPRKDSSIDGGHHLKVMYPNKKNFTPDDAQFNNYLMRYMSLFSQTSVGGANEHARKDEARAGCHQAASLLHTAVFTGEGHSPHQHETRTQETAGGDP